MKLKSNISVGTAKATSARPLPQLGLFPEIQRPPFADTLSFPADLTKLESSNISELHGKYTALYAYANQELSKANVTILRLNTKISIETNRLLRERPSLNHQERWRRDAVLDGNPVIEAITAQIGQVKVLKTYAEMHVVNFEKYLAALSRELSRKSFESGLR